MKPNFVKQIDKRYRNLNYHGMTMGGGGCGVMTCYNIISVLTKPHLTVRGIWNYMTKKGYVIPGRGTTWDGITQTLKHYGIKNFKVTYSDKEVKECLDKGMWLVGLCGRSRWTSSGHYICIYDITKSGKLLISDPYSSSDYCQKDAPLQEYLDCNKCNWVFIDPKEYKVRENDPKTTKTYVMYVDFEEGRVRSEPGKNKKLITKLPPGTKLTLHNYEKGWYQIKKGKYKGNWIGQSYLTNLPPYVEKMQTQSQRNIRNGATTKADIIGKAPKGKTYTTSKKLGDWVFIPSVKGWIRYKSGDGKKAYLKKV
jgi:hypothetical protein